MTKERQRELETVAHVVHGPLSETFNEEFTTETNHLEENAGTGIFSYLAGRLSAPRRDTSFPRQDMSVIRRETYFARRELLWL